MSFSKHVIPLPSPKVFETQIGVQISAINYGNHVGYDAMVSLLHEAQVQFLDHYHYSEFNIAGCYLLVQKIEVIYKKEVRYREILLFTMGLGETSKARQELLFSVQNAEYQEVCRARITLAFLDHHTKTLVSPPTFFLELKMAV
ncbi:MAG: acyl-CoA thioesterase [Gammaproteobacteria bacterium]|nr:acyl-CoA thioesterase [Gammaproteobacteria bacterium]